MNTVYVNARFLTQEMTGVQRFAVEISRQLKSLLGDRVKFVAPSNIKFVELADELQAEIVGKHTGYCWEQIELPRYLKRKGSPVLLNFCSVAPLLYDNNILAIHDITWVRYPDTYSFRFRTAYNFLVPRLARKAAKIITVSDFSLKEISGYYNIPENRFVVAHNAVSQRFSQVIDDSLRNENYFVAVSSIKENKNFPMVIESFNLLKKRLPDVKLYIIGDVREKVFGNVSLDICGNPDIVLLGRVSDNELIRYYSNAVGFIFPSLYEGFGIPVLEAQACGCPVISSNSGSLPEVLLDSALLCSPDDAQAFADNMYAVATDMELRNVLKDKGKKNIERFSWEESARKILNNL